MSASKAPTVINSELKKVKPPTAYSCCMADCANMKVYFKLFNDCLSSKDDEHVERLTHLIVLASRLHNAALEGGLLPLVKQLSSGGGTMAQEMSEMVRKKEECAAKIDSTKKHVSNDEFCKLMKEFEQLSDQGVESEVKALQAVVKEIDEATLIDAADRMEQAKASATLAPGVLSYA